MNVKWGKKASNDDFYATYEFLVEFLFILISFLLSFYSKAKVLYKLFRTEPRKSEDLVPVMDKLRIPREDDGLLKFWMRALTDEYKAHLKELTSMPTTGGPARESTKSFNSHDQKVFWSKLLKAKVRG